MNKVYLIGNLTKDPELTETPSGIAVCKFSIAVSRAYSGADGQKETDFFNCTAWRSQAESMAKYQRKGNKIAIVGSIQNRTYEDTKGNKKFITDIIANEVEFLTPKTDSEQSKGKPKLEAYDDENSDSPF